MSNTSIIVNEVDFCAPAQKFRFEYSTVEKGGFPLVPEFILRLLNLSNLMPQEIATFFGFTKKELDEALRPFIDNNDIEYRTDGRIALTYKAKRYFDSASDEPLLTKIEVYRQSYIFDLLTFSPAEKIVQPSFNSYLSLKLEAGIEPRSNSELLAKKAFQNYFYELWQQQVELFKLKSRNVEIYKISEVRKDSDVWIRSSEDFILDLNTMAIRNISRLKMANDKAYMQQRAQVLKLHLGINNTKDIALLASVLDDEETVSLLGSRGINFSEMVVSEFQSSIQPKKFEKRLFGSLTSKSNQDILAEILRKYSKVLSKEKNHDIITLRWIAPVNSFWGASERYRACLSLLANFDTDVNKKAKYKIIDTQLYLPLKNSKDFSTARKWQAAFREQGNTLHAFVECQAIAPLEIVMLSGRFALILYHLVQPDNYQVPFPLGFITEDTHKLKKIEQYLDGCLSQYIDEFKPRYLGKVIEFLNEQSKLSK
ncbi:hypothetical protein [Arsenophonus endosymbiont of Apis mellifera]|uniref:hypothetical protein n=1 Tax=Arsenophonus endosymbiont of Apis mellifera TaxID=1541805 RepID=UPI0015D8579F|nr:hypothetical protein [Arsenophonus endosymbiont of Apis mellifera]